MTVARRVDGTSKNDTRAFDFGRWAQLEGGSFSFDNGHCVLWNDYANYQDRPNYEILDWLKRERGEERATWMNGRSEEHTSELQSLMRISYAVFCLKKKT